MFWFYHKAQDGYEGANEAVRFKDLSFPNLKVFLEISNLKYKAYKSIHDWILPFVAILTVDS